MTTTFKKLNYKDQKEICIINHPAEFNDEVEAMKGTTDIKTDPGKCEEIDFVLVFVKSIAEVDAVVPDIDKKLKGDGIVWFAYPKGTSKKYKVNINRDNGWQSLGKYGYEGVRAVAIDEDWSALRFRRVTFIKKMTRSFAMSDEGKNKARKS
ncbi:hypothetical protein C900_02573 [Fulvivirga imtechensis AK7]|uniref:DUF3052 domain-containing protein n=1 Tax=Fulvivirga imtechensis AK7 TaxID=1237149 RepID=L8JRM0_9BACT|nr:hypothetical protein [Fulvivirga imtechensis]ELR71510.1 hypothetical protein C900_02573 [Fulvivirga imtechensis AK7]